MASPRIFVSSTCYDLSEIRFQLRNFIGDFGYDPVMSEFDDIFYNYEKHVQDACLEEIPKCQLFVLVVGNNYGSFYHLDKQKNKTPDSVTLKEFRKALEIKIYKHIFINKYVDYDYKNYKRALEKTVLKVFQESNVSDDMIDATRARVKREFDDKYPFAFDSYKYVFYFLDIITDLKEGNAISTFESFTDIKEGLRKQWAGFMYESLTKKNKIDTSSLLPMEMKIDKMEKSLSLLLETKMTSSDSKVSIDIESLMRNKSIESLEKAQDKIAKCLEDICTYEVSDSYENIWWQDRIKFDQKLDAANTKEWLEYLKPLVQSYKWSKRISTATVFKNLPLSNESAVTSEIGYKSLFELYSLYDSLSDADKDHFVITIMEKLNFYFDEQAVPEPKQPAIIDDDLPF